MFCLVRIKKKVAVACVCCLLILCGAVFATAVAAQEEKVQLPVIMYHSVIDNLKYCGKYVISPAELEKDFKFLQENGYTAIGQEELENYVKNGASLPEKPVLLTFDDGYYNNYLYAYPLAQKYNMKIIISPIGYWSDQYSGEEKLSQYYSHCTWAQIEEMAQSGVVEFGNHTFNLHKSEGARLGANKIPGESPGDYTALLKSDITTMQEKLSTCTGMETGIFTYPFGAVSKEAPGVIRDMGFTISLSCETRTNTITRDPDSLYMLGRYLRTQTAPVSTFLTNHK